MGRINSNSLMFWGMREDRQHLTLSFPCSTTSPATAHRVLANALCDQAVSQLLGKIPTLPPPQRSPCGNYRKGVQSLPQILAFFFRSGGCKTSYGHKGKMGDSEKISMFGKRKLFGLFFPSLRFNLEDNLVIFCCWKLALLHRQTFSSASQA